MPRKNNGVRFWGLLVFSGRCASRQNTVFPEPSGWILGMKEILRKQNLFACSDESLRGGLWSSYDVS